jgi:diaminopimelate epimerase
LDFEFFKYHGTGNDFILIDNRNLSFNADKETIEKLCHRQFGIGADGLILIQNHNELDFNMRYFNSDGKEASMCGNGGRCAVSFAAKLGIIKSETSFFAFDGIHKALISNDIIELSMSNVTGIKDFESIYILDTGSPQAIIFVSDLEKIDVFNDGRKIRNDKNISQDGVNVNFVKIISSNEINIRTYERGVENETYSCGTGSVASAIVSYLKNNVESFDYSVNVNVKGGRLIVNFKTADKKTFTHIKLTGPAIMVFSGKISM